VVQIIIRLVEKTMSQSGAYEYTDKAVEEHGIKLLFGEFLFSIETMHEQIDTDESQAPAKTVPANSDKAQLEGYYIGVPGDE